MKDKGWIIHALACGFILVMVGFFLWGLTFIGKGLNEVHANDVNNDLRIYKDIEYGCEYLTPNSTGSGIVPRMNAKGEQVGCIK